jgi:aminoglycoside phosphotransferase
MQLEILGNQVKFEWGLGCFEIAAELLKVDTVEEVIFSVGNTAKMCRVAYAAIQNWYEIEGKEIPFNVRQFQNWLDKADEETGVKIVEDFMASQYQGKVMKQRYDELIEMLKTDDEPVKKKVTRGRKSEK